MTDSTLYHDGYIDGLTNQPKSPPFHPHTSTYTIEYLDGYAAGTAARKPLPSVITCHCIECHAVYERRGKAGESHGYCHTCGPAILAAADKEVDTCLNY